MIHARRAEPRAPIVHVVEDDEPMRKATARLLQAAGHAVRTYGTAAEFLNASPTRTAGCVVLDLQLPGPSGLDVQRALIRRRTASRRLPERSRRGVGLRPGNESRRCRLPHEVHRWQCAARGRIPCARTLDGRANQAVAAPGPNIDEADLFVALLEHRDMRGRVTFFNFEFLSFFVLLRAGKVST